MTTVNQDPRVNAFLQLVHGQPEDIGDVPQGRLPGVSSLATVETQSPDVRRRMLGDKPLYFGKHKGKTLKDVSHDDLRWTAQQKPYSRSYRKFQKAIEEYLSLALRTSDHELSRETTEELDPLSRESLAITQHG